MISRCGVEWAEENRPQVTGRRAAEYLNFRS